MSLSYLKDGVVRKLESRAAALAQEAIDYRIHPSMASDAYAMAQVDRLAMARGLTEAMNIVIAEYKRLTELPAKQDEGGILNALAKEPVY